AVTGVLRLLAFAVAFIGILGALMALQLERSRELGVLRAQGLTPGQLWGVVTAQTGILGLVSGLLALPAGALLAAVMVHVVNRRSFGWTLDLAFGG
ncbi:MAG: FtsX-like permease family protein, partial [Gemmatimonadetes bacterium]|nr:FtsX-like permease family protein [Gemmatimonadota bacterium]NIR80215.1 FtsX-like permease family protein [Gemmatimonadota bacterium]NIT88980.1 FtsX-like permease family protein [Gemmatimonadota bacterium]NIU32776.1 FtsX-like permease family protein [Gemmatimonadota bacterium]NIU37207.1 FtsX-like permease family protein [Gemmatimonadota bacterium]